MNKAQNLVLNVKERAEQKGYSLKSLCVECGIGINTFYNIKDNKGISCFSLEKVADVLECSMDELLGRNCAK